MKSTLLLLVTACFLLVGCGEKQPAKPADKKTDLKSDLEAKVESLVKKACECKKKSGTPVGTGVGTFCDHVFVENEKLSKAIQKAKYDGLKNKLENGIKKCFY